MTNSLEIECSALKVTRHKIERVGCAYFNARRQIGDANGVERSDSDEKLAGAGEDVDISYLKSLDPKEWKDQDHYSVLGLGKLRYEASDDDIRKAYRRMVLLHHPDKRKAKGEEVITDDDYFTCITKAYEILGTPKTRRSYDSVDPEFDDGFPSQSDIDNNYFESFNKYFNLNARWSEKPNVPPFGDVDAKREDVERFYNFWYDFKSWREFSYLDEEDKEKGQDRDERRWIEKENKTARIKRKKEEMTRIRALVDLAYNNDKRIQRLKQEEKDRKAAAKRAKMDAAQAQKAEQERAIREAALAKEKAEKAEQKRIEQIRIEREQQKKVLKKERKTLRDKVKDCKYYAKNDKDQLKHMEGTEKICETFNLAELQALNKAMETKGRESFIAALHTAEQKIAAELEELNIAHQKKQVNNTPKTGVKEVKKSELWSNENVQLLIKAVNLFPAGTAQRWDVIATFINQHCSGGSSPVTARDVLNKAKALQNSDHSKSSLKTQANEGAFQSFEKSKKEVQTTNDITLGESPAESKENHKQNGGVSQNNQKQQQQRQQQQQQQVQQQSESKQNGSAVGAPASTPATTPTTNGIASKTWTKEEQALLEQAIKTYPTTTPDRWDCIAACIPNRSKKDCLRRVKELVELVNSKKEAQAAVK
ncbi:PREDICTED: dnaJ homolog subfamily C member 2 [Drosophila arizonae]|uniref:DnaJ homolog subfamily C member 2 n=1 Tax=Drosophila arizonae TaxID=7263 RepID=A0ABM1P6M8_DROAR|nr:PREDICTED: dnaJ homolog subfamily C member 2 [Drosophila arizonae]